MSSKIFAYLADMFRVTRLFILLQIGPTMRLINICHVSTRTYARLRGQEAVMAMRDGVMSKTSVVCGDWSEDEERGRRVNSTGCGECAQAPVIYITSVKLDDIRPRGHTSPRSVMQFNCVSVVTSRPYIERKSGIGLFRELSCCARTSMALHCFVVVPVARLEVYGR